MGISVGHEFFGLACVVASDFKMIGSIILIDPTRVACGDVEQYVGHMYSFSSARKAPTPSPPSPPHSHTAAHSPTWRPWLPPACVSAPPAPPPAPCAPALQSCSGARPAGGWPQPGARRSQQQPAGEDVGVSNTNCYSGQGTAATAATAATASDGSTAEVLYPGNHNHNRLHTCSSTMQGTAASSRPPTSCMCADCSQAW